MLSDLYMASIGLEGVSRTYPGGIAAVEELSLEVSDKEFMVLVGPSGCGKSSTLRMIAGLEEPTAGRISIGGRVVNDVPPKDRDIAMVFQNYALYPHMSVYRNMAFGLELRYGSSLLTRTFWRVARPSKAADMAERRKMINRRVRQAAQSLGIENLLDRLPRELSGGERQRVALGRAIVRQPAAFLFDEPLSNLDAKLRLQMRRELKELHRRLQATMVYVTHDQTEALTMGDRIAVMYGGTLQQLGTPLEVYDEPCNLFVAGFIGAPPMNLVHGTLEADGDVGVFRASGWSVPVGRNLYERVKQYAGKPLVLGIRPEHVRQEHGGQGRGLTATVSVVEPLGDGSIVHLQIEPEGGASADSVTPIVGKWPPRPAVEPGERLAIAFDMDFAHWFDPKSEKNVGQPAGHAG